MKKAVSREAREEWTLCAGFTVEVILERSLRVKPRVTLGVEDGENVAGGVGTDGVECFIDCTEADFGLHRLAGCILRKDIEGAFFTRKVFVLAGRSGDG